MSEAGSGSSDQQVNVARPVARYAGMVAYLADLATLSILAVQVVLGRLSAANTIVVGLLVVVGFVVAAGLSLYGDGQPMPGLRIYAWCYAVIAAVLLVVAGIEPDDAGRNPFPAVVLIAAASVVMATVTGRTAAIPPRRLAIPLMLGALILVAVTPFVVLTVDLPGTSADGPRFSLVRLLFALLSIALSLGWVLSVQASVNGPRASLDRRPGR